MKSRLFESSPLKCQLRADSYIYEPFIRGCRDAVSIAVYMDVEIRFAVRCIKGGNLLSGYMELKRRQNSQK